MARYVHLVGSVALDTAFYAATHVLAKGALFLAVALALVALLKPRATVLA